VNEIFVKKILEKFLGKNWNYFPHYMVMVYLLLKKYIMKRIVRLTERDLTRLVKRVIKENKFKEMDDCEVIISNMEYVFNDFMSFVKTSPEEQSPEDMYDDIESELAGFLNMAEEMECENIDEVYMIYDELINDFRSYVGL